MAGYAIGVGQSGYVYGRTPRLLESKLVVKDYDSCFVVSVVYRKAGSFTFFVAGTHLYLSTNEYFTIIYKVQG